MTTAKLENEVCLLQVIKGHPSGYHGNSTHFTPIFVHSTEEEAMKYATEAAETYGDSLPDSEIESNLKYGIGSFLAVWQKDGQLSWKEYMLQSDPDDFPDWQIAFDFALENLTDAFGRSAGFIEAVDLAPIQSITPLCESGDIERFEIIRLEVISDGEPDETYVSGTVDVRVASPYCPFDAKVNFYTTHNDGMTKIIPDGDIEPRNFALAEDADEYLIGNEIENQLVIFEHSSSHTDELYDRIDSLLKEHQKTEPEQN